MTNNTLRITEQNLSAVSCDDALKDLEAFGRSRKDLEGSGRIGRDWEGFGG